MAKQPKQQAQQQPQQPPPIPRPIDPSVRSSRAFTLWTADDFEPPRPPAPRMGTLWTEPVHFGVGVEIAQHRPVLTVLRPMTSGRHVLCAFAGRNDLVCEVGSAANFRARMEIRGAFLRPPLNDVRLWRYTGKLPRRSGHW